MFYRFKKRCITISNNEQFIGINIGSVSVNVVSIDEKGTPTIFKRAHLGKPVVVLEELLQELEPTKRTFYGISGSFGEISEIAAIERGIQALNEKFDAIISLGGEALILYVLDEQGFIVNVLSHDKCAAGSGEFFIQQIDRLGLSLEEAIKLAAKGKKVEIASRCSVHCKSDITHKLNKGEATVEDLLLSVLASMVNKVKGLLIQAQKKMNRLLVIGGVALNDVFVKLLREDLPDVDVVIKDVSPVFEAYGTALLVKDKPIEDELKLKMQKSFTKHPSLRQFAKQVKIFEAPKVSTNFDKNKAFILGVDVGSTTTKAVLLDPDEKSILASYYGRTNGKPIEATTKCIKEILKQVGDVKIYLVGVTGSGRALVGAYLGTGAIYNEISAHSEGAVFFDPEVDTIFEIGGQDSKYMYLQNGVPVDYAMNAACSAGTGSFLEESAKGDLGISVYDISNIAIDADMPVRFKADCAAFINTDIRTALQEGYRRDDIIGGLVYSIVDNYLNKVKGSRPIGKKVFFQGGVAKNHSVGYAFAQATESEIIIPPNPELMGAFGIALLVKNKYEQHEINGMPEQTTLKGLIKSKLKSLGTFTCKACENYCTIERYEVGGRRFSFGGSCSRYEHQWRHMKVEEKPDYVHQRNQLILESGDETQTETQKKSKGKIGIPRALLVHSLFPLYSTFFKELGYEVVLSKIDKERELMTNAAFCFPIQILHGAVLDLIKKKDITRIFLPHVHNLPKGDKWLDATFCPITQASPYFISTAFKNVDFLKPVLDYSEGYENSDALITMAVEELNETRLQANEAYQKAVEKQLAVENQLQQMGEEIIKELQEKDEIGILLVGRSYNAFPPETSLRIPKKLASMGVTVIPFDFLKKEEVNDIPWFFVNYAKVAINLAKKYDNLFLLYINSFSCTIDAFSQNYVRSEMDSKPYLMLELDAHTADAGIQTRLEAFLEIIKNYRAGKRKEEPKPFQVAKVKRRNGRVVVITSKGKQISIRDPRVKLYLPSFSKYHTEIGDKILSLFGFNAGGTTEIKLDYLLKGYRYSSGKECIPLPVVLGQILTLVKNRKPGEIIGMYMIRGGAPCAVYSYFHYIEQFLEKNQIEDVFLYRFDYLTKFLGTKLTQVIRHVPAAIIMGDLMWEIESSLRVVGEDGSVELLHTYWQQFLDEAKTLKDYRRGIKKLIRNIAKIPRKMSPKDAPKVLVSGDFFVRFSDFFLGELREIYAKEGIIVKSTDLFELSIYAQSSSSSYLVNKEWKKNPDKLGTILKATTSLWDDVSQILLVGKIGTALMLRIEKRLRKRFKRTGLLYAHPNDLTTINRLSEPLISPLIFGEAIPTVGKGMEALEGSLYDSLVLTGPFNCLPYKVSQAILKPIYLENQMPFLVFDVDITAVNPNVKRLIYANIEQIKRRREDIILQKQRQKAIRIRGRVSKLLQKRLRRKMRKIERRDE
ncbi:MAG: hypothetical protein DRP02_05270 [Candidatus Gerdarchaeota archaeon]|nr:MAG: hypothetical protein DRP02_05270 [Candidatus Gerdarchaeota archaeon]